LRFSFAVSRDHLDDALRRLAAWGESVRSWLRACIPLFFSITGLSRTHMSITHDNSRLAGSKRLAASAVVSCSCACMGLCACACCVTH